MLIKFNEDIELECDSAIFQENNKMTGWEVVLSDGTFEKYSSQLLARRVDALPSMLLSNLIKDCLTVTATGLALASLEYCIDVNIGGKTQMRGWLLQLDNGHWIFSQRTEILHAYLKYVYGDAI